MWEKLKSEKKFIKNYIWQFLQVASRQGVSFAIFMIGTYLLSKSDMGAYNFILSFLSMLVLFADFGISTATSKYVAEYRATKKDNLKIVFFNGLVPIFLISALVFIVTYIFRAPLLKEYVTYYPLIIPILFISPIVSLLEGIFRGMKRFKASATISIWGGLLVIILSYFFTLNWGLRGAIYSQVLLYSLLLILLLIRNGFGVFKYDKKVASSIIKYSVAFGLASVGYYLFSRVIVYMMGQYGYFEPMAHYELLNKIFTIFLIPFTILGQVLAPYSTEIYAKKEYGKIVRRYKEYVRYLGGLGSLFIIFGSLGAYFLITIFTPEYAVSQTWTILLPVAVIYAQMAFSAPINSGIIVATGYAGIMTWLNVVAGIFNVILAIVLMNTFGFVGGIYSILITQSIAMVVLNVVFFGRVNKLVGEKDE